MLLGLQWLLEEIFMPGRLSFAKMFFIKHIGRGELFY